MFANTQNYQVCSDDCLETSKVALIWINKAILVSTKELQSAGKEELSKWLLQHIIQLSSELSQFHKDLELILNTETSLGENIQGNQVSLDSFNLMVQTSRFQLIKIKLREGSLQEARPRSQVSRSGRTEISEKVQTYKQETSLVQPSIRLPTDVVRKSPFKCFRPFSEDH